MRNDLNHVIATELLAWGYAAGSDTYWIDVGVCVGDAKSFNPLTDEYQGKLAISELELSCDFVGLKDYVESLTQMQKAEIRHKYIVKQREKYIKVPVVV